MVNMMAATSIKWVAEVFTISRWVEKQSGQERLTAIFNCDICYSFIFGNSNPSISFR
ncbi:hypothetical protein [Superficieibacter sp.]|uniref:hypothetical protein n=1 Tax=Superficieibacter sp. TaxID=2303322 RepID=UPI0028AD1A51|nr:hypothetical protein [Superficieibacter sp.]